MEDTEFFQVLLDTRHQICLGLKGHAFGNSIRSQMLKAYLWSFSAALSPTIVLYQNHWDDSAAPLVRKSLEILALLRHLTYRDAVEDGLGTCAVPDKELLMLPKDEQDQRVKQQQVWLRKEKEKRLNGAKELFWGYFPEDAQKHMVKELTETNDFWVAAKEEGFTEKCNWYALLHRTGLSQFYAIDYRRLSYKVHGSQQLFLYSDDRDNLSRRTLLWVWWMFVALVRRAVIAEGGSDFGVTPVETLIATKYPTLG